MSRAKTNKLYRTFVRGLFTEASPLTFPEDTSYDEDNCLIYSKGNRTRRLGANFEPASVLTGPIIASPVNIPITEYTWLNVNNNVDLNFLCVQIGGFIYFYDQDATPISNSSKSFTIDLTAYAVAGVTGIEQSPVQMASGKGFLFIAGPKIEPLSVEYDPDTDTITVEQIPILIRDFDGVDDDLAVDEEPTTLSVEHHYNLRNQGWTTQSTETTKAVTLYGKFRIAQTSTQVVDTITEYFSAISTYPGNNKQWFLGKDTNEDFDPVLLNKAHVGNTRAPRGHYVVNAFEVDRSDVSGIPGLVTEIKKYRPQSVTFFSGRAWWSARNDLFFSQLMTNKGKAGQCFQEADPTAEDINELVATDGGRIPIPGADEIVRIVEIGNGVVAFARNGVWVITGSDKGFSALEYAINKISNIGTDAPMSIVLANDVIYWWSKTGIQAIQQQSGQFGPIPGAYSSTNITATTIDSLIKTVSTAARQFVKGVYDTATETIHWAYRSADFEHDYGYDRMLNFDLKLKAFYPWSLASSEWPFIAGLFINTELSTEGTFLKFTCLIYSGGNYRMTMGSFYNDAYVDWESYVDGVEYESFVESGYEILEDAFRKKQIIYLTAFFEQTEENWVEVSPGEYEPDKPSSCYLQVKWDWTTSGSTGKWSTKFQAYRHRRIPLVDPSDLTFNTGTRVVSSKNKIRGNGRSLQFRFGTNERGKNFNLLGWQSSDTGNTDA